MTRLSASAVVIGDDDITIDADLLAAKLDLSVSELKANMAKGLVTSLAETGTDEDAGRTRLTFRYRARVWRVVREADGRLREDPVPRAKPTAAKGRVSLLDLAGPPS